ncbi:MAG TPA: sigma 54-interacting transcriptional regulator, partial [Planctomycetaceae bacterium]|nr:sigma 54-interacting transcriptional regulator [Planctomycetaceae bacterium]
MKTASQARWVLSASGVLVLFYCLFVLAFVGTSPDLGLRVLLTDSLDSRGPVIQYVTASLRHKGQEPPKAGDILLAIGPPSARWSESMSEGGDAAQRPRLQPVTTFLHFTRALMDLRRETPAGGTLPRNSDPAELGQVVPPLVEIDAPRWIDRQRWVEIEFLRPGNPEPVKTWLLVQSLPVWEVVLSFVWFILQLGIFSVGAAAFWSRPFDRPARLFFAMCTVTAGAFVGGYHWWVIAASVWLSIPFCICALLVPVVTLHFFLIYPHSKPPLTMVPRLTLAAMYAVPVIAIGVFVVLIVYAAMLYSPDVPREQLRNVLELTRLSIHAYLVFAAASFMATILALGYSFFTTRNPIEHNQVKWILWAGVASIPPVAYTLYLAQFQRVEFAMGEGSVPMFIASLLFMLAYAVGILRFKLMLVDQLFSREVYYFFAGVGATGLYSLSIALLSLFGIYQNLQSSRSALVIAATLMGAVILLGWVRDWFQQIIDRRFFREKYQLDKALQRLNQTVGNLAEPSVLAERFLGSCRDVLLVDQAALYLREPGKNTFRLVGSDVASRAPLQFQAEEAWLDEMLQASSLQRINPEKNEDATSLQQFLQRLKVEVLHALEIEGKVEGLVLLGRKRNGAAYTAEDLTFLTAIGQATSVALQSARVHQAVGRLNEELRSKIEKIGDQQRMIAMLQAEIVSRQELDTPRDPDAFRRDLIKGSSPAIRRVLDTVQKVSSSESSVLIRGESGTGKELLARALHENSPRRDGPLVQVLCGALAPGVLESELFGHVKGAFTSAHRDKVGRFEMANGGTLFLDEIGDISLETQVKLLRVLQERAFEPVGGTRTVQVDVRLIAATHQNLERLIAEGRFREDLFYRLNVISITLPPLREREHDVFELALYFLERASSRVGKRITHLDEEALEALRGHRWPGNIRELENVIERAVVLAEGTSITLLDLPPEVTSPAPYLSIETKPLLLETPRSTESPKLPGEREQLLQAL